MMSPRRSVKEERTRLKEYCASSQDATGFCVTSYRSFVAKSIASAIYVACPYFAEMDFTMSSAVSPFVRFDRRSQKSCRARRCRRRKESVRRYPIGTKSRGGSAATKSVPVSALDVHEPPSHQPSFGQYAPALWSS